MKKFLFTIIAVALVIGITGSAFAYFTDVETSQDNVVAAGTLNMQISDVNEGWRDAPVHATFSASGLAPGQEFPTNAVSLRNVGTIDINRIWGRFSTLVESDGAIVDPEVSSPLNNISKYIKLVAYEEQTSNSAWTPALGETGPDGEGFYTESFPVSNANEYLAYWAGRGAAVNPTQGYITLADLVEVSNFGSGDYVTGLLFFDATPTPFIPPLPVNAIAQIRFVFQLLPETPNYYQGDTASFRVDFIGSQRTNYPDPLLGDSITEPLGGMTITPPYTNHP